MARGIRRRRGHMHDPAISFTPRRSVPQLDLAHALEYRNPKVAEYREWLSGHHRLVQHFPDDRQLDVRSCPTLASHESMRDADQFKQAVLPGGHANFFINPRICSSGEKLRG